jgi:aminoglycoside phosphotransferase family enzyme/predicted kinase
MELAHLLEALSKPSAYSHPVDRVEVCHTHISVVFLAGPYAYKIKKPVEMGFLDFSTLEKRRHYCEEEVRLNRRLAPTVYRGVVPVTRSGGSIQMEGPGDVIEWAVKMQRLPQEATLERRLQRGEVGIELVETLARQVAEFHARAEGGESIGAFGRFEVVARNARENFEQSVPQVGLTISQAVYGRLCALTVEALVKLHPLIQERARRRLPRDTHGDLHLDHVYLLPDRAPPADLVIIDCIEFNERFRFADPVADMAFLVMDLLFHGRRDLAQAFADAYFRASGDEEGRSLLPFYVAYRAAVRGKVEGFELTEKEVPEAERAAALTRARAHWLLALGQLEEPGLRPGLVLVGGLPGSGKSTLVQGLADRAGFSVVRSDLVRKELAQLHGQDWTPAPFGEGLYTPEWTERTYAECLRRTETLLFSGKRVVVDASFREEKRRHMFLEAATRWGVPGIFLLCQAEPEIIREHLLSRTGDASTADWSIYLEAAKHWEEPALLTRQVLFEIPTGLSRGTALSRALEVLREFNLQDNQNRTIP